MRSHFLRATKLTTINNEIYHPLVSISQTSTFQQTSYDRYKCVALCLIMSPEIFRLLSDCFCTLIFSPEYINTTVVLNYCGLLFTTPVSSTMGRWCFYRCLSVCPQGDGGKPVFGPRSLLQLVVPGPFWGNSTPYGRDMERVVRLLRSRRRAFFSYIQSIFYFKNQIENHSVL